MGADVRGWYSALPRAVRMLPHKRPGVALGRLVGLPGQAAAAAGQGQTVGRRLPLTIGGNGGMRQGVIEQHFLSSHCAVCDEQTLQSRPLCPRCMSDPGASLAVLLARTARLERQHTHMVRMCLHCGGGGGGNSGGTRGRDVDRETGQMQREDEAVGPDPSRSHPSAAWGDRQPSFSSAATASGLCAGAGGVVCDSLDCGVYFERRKLAQELVTMSALTQASCHVLGDW